jgi:hypothetical protein
LSLKVVRLAELKNQKTALQGGLEVIIF